MHARWLYSPRPEHGTVLHHVPSSLADAQPGRLLVLNTSMTTSPWCVMAVRSGWPGSSRPGWWWTRPSPRSSSAAAGLTAVARARHGTGRHVRPGGEPRLLRGCHGAAGGTAAVCPVRRARRARGGIAGADPGAVAHAGRMPGGEPGSDAGHAYGRAWLRWSEAQGQQRSTPADDWEGTLAAPGARQGQIAHSFRFPAGS